MGTFWSVFRRFGYIVGGSVVILGHSWEGAIPNFATEKEQKRNFLDFNDVTLVVVDIKSERFVNYVFTAGLV